MKITETEREAIRLDIERDRLSLDAADLERQLGDVYAELSSVNRQFEAIEAVIGTERLMEVL